MVSVFVSHSKHDRELVQYFSQVFTNIGLKAKFMEWEILDNKYAGYEITQIIRSQWLSGHDTAAVFVLLGRGLQSPPTPTPQFTHNWVNFEVGVAAGSTKPVWVFEGVSDFIHFPIPFVTDYVPYVLNSIEDLRIVSEIINQRLMVRNYNYRPRYQSLRCPYQDCNAVYNYWGAPNMFYCPVCRRSITIEGQEPQNR